MSVHLLNVHQKNIKIRHICLLPQTFFIYRRPQRYELTTVLVLIYKVETQSIAYKIICTCYLHKEFQVKRTSNFSFCLQIWLKIWKKEENFSCVLDKPLNIIKIIDISTTFTKQYLSNRKRFPCLHSLI